MLLRYPQYGKPGEPDGSPGIVLVIISRLKMFKQPRAALVLHLVVPVHVGPNVIPSALAFVRSPISVLEGRSRRVPVMVLFACTVGCRSDKTGLLPGALEADGPFNPDRMPPPSIGAPRCPAGDTRRAV